MGMSHVLPEPDQIREKPEKMAKDREANHWNGLVLVDGG